jgi:hypothetical protein
MHPLFYITVSLHSEAKKLSLSLSLSLSHTHTHTHTQHRSDNLAMWVLQMEVRVQNLDCEGCATKLKKALFKLKSMFCILIYLLNCTTYKEVFFFFFFSFILFWGVGMRWRMYTFSLTRCTQCERNDIYIYIYIYIYLMLLLFEFMNLIY